MFEKKGQIIISKEECEMDADDLMMMALDDRSRRLQRRRRQL